MVPAITKKHATAEWSEALPVIQRALAIELLYGVVFMIAAAFLAPIFLPIILGPMFSDSIIILQVLGCMLPFTALTHAIGLYIFVPKKLEIYNVVSIIVGVIVMTVLALLVFGSQGGIGMAYARLAGEVVTTAVLILAIARENILVSL